MTAREPYEAIRTKHAYEFAVAITPSDTEDLQFFCSAIYVGAVGDVTVVTMNNQVVLFKAPPIGTIIPLRCRRVNSTGTTSSQLVAMW